MPHPHREPDSYHRILSDMRELLHEILVVLKPPRQITPVVTFSGRGIVSFTVGEKETFMAVVKKDGGPLKMDVSGFVNDSGNPVTDTDPATYTSSDESVATVVNDPADAQDGVITLTGKVSDEGTEVVITAAFPAQKYGQAFSVVGHLTVIEPPAAGATASITGPGVVDGA